MAEVTTDAGYDVASIRKGIQQVIHDASFREELIQKGLENVRRFEPGVVAEQYLEIYKWEKR